MKVILSPQSEKNLRKIPKLDQIAIARKIRILRDEKNSAGEEKLKGYKNIFRLRVGNYRLVYRKQASSVYIILIRHRKDVYQFLKTLLD